MNPLGSQSDTHFWPSAEAALLLTVFFGLLALFLLTLLAAASAGCGNYSNDDLEYMSIVPQREELASNLPRTTAALQLTLIQPELARSHCTEPRLRLPFEKRRQRFEQVVRAGA